MREELRTMFGGAGTIVLIVIMRVVSARAWRGGVGLSPVRRLAIPAVSLVIALVALRSGGGQVFGSGLVLPVVIAAVLTAAGGVVRARGLEYSSVPDSPMHPGGLTIRTGDRAVAADVAGTLCAAALIFPFVAPAAGLSAAAGAWTLALVIGDAVLSVLVVLRGRPAELVR